MFHEILVLSENLSEKQYFSQQKTLFLMKNPVLHSLPIRIAIQITHDTRLA